MQTADPQPLRSHVIKGPICVIVFFPDEKRIVTGGHQDGSAHIWNLDTGKEDGDPLRGHSGPVTSLAVSRDGNGVVTGGADRKVLLWTIGSKRRPKSRLLFSAPNNSQYSFLSFNSTDKIPNIIATASTNGLIDIWELKSNTDPTQIKQIIVPATTITSVHFSTDNLDLLALVCGDRKVKLFNVRSGEKHAEFDGPSATVLSLAWFPGMKRIVSAAHKTIYIGDAQNDVSTFETISGHTQTVKSLAVHQRGEFIASGGDDKVLRVWDARTHVQIGNSPHHPGAITNVIFSPDGKRILSISGMNKMFLWNVHDLGIHEGSSAPSSESSDGSFTASNPLAEYFARYSRFDYDADEPATSEFYRMCSYFKWDRGTEARDNAYEAFRIALTQQFNALYGTDAESLSSWQLLCARLGTNPIPNSAKKCREIFCATHVNLVDLVQGEGHIRKFATVYELSDYSKRTGKIFPREEAYAGGLLRHLLRHISNPSMDNERSGGGSSRRQVSRENRHYGGR